uniref:Glycosyltransferase subfamily 4-like N-terminal domain-containing protein n=1 Tax=Corethron hystrix TaxID=216773 RepID=A0A7S1FZS5_9STRA|mmetsp:Transcript_42015/g.98430  ORF Transcript_42015/g.98430 Transcript_42015/m.98430 type:complete len:686 (+) Transcript_42015:124-2181(+)
MSSSPHADAGNQSFIFPSPTSSPLSNPIACKNQVSDLLSPLHTCNSRIEKATTSTMSADNSFHGSCHSILHPLNIFNSKIENGTTITMSADTTTETSVDSSFESSCHSQDSDDLECSMISIPSVSSLPRYCCPHRVLIYTTCYNVIDGVTLTVRKIEAEILDGGGHVCILTTRSGSDHNTNLVGTHPNRTVVFLDKAVPIPFLNDENNPDCSYYLGFSMSNQDKEKIDHFGPTICHITVPDCVGLDVIQYARQNSLPLMGTYHSNIVDYMDHYGLFWLKPILAAFFAHVYNFLQALYVPTPYIKRKLIQCEKLNRITNLQIWGRGIDLETFSPVNRSNEFRKKLGILPDEVVILFVGRLVVEKRPDIFANVIRRLHREGHHFKALVVGAGPYENEIKKLPNTIYMGWQSGEDLSIAYASSDIFLFPSALETFGNVTLEAAASGLPLVVEEDCSGHLVLDGMSGFTCEKGDESSFYEKTLELLTNERLRKSFSIQSRRHSLKYEMQTLMRQMTDNYTAVTDEFHNTYQANHIMRDLEYKNPDSFRAGMSPRPALLRLVEILVVWSIPAIWFLYLSYHNLRKKCSSAWKWTTSVSFIPADKSVSSLEKEWMVEPYAADRTSADLAATRTLSVEPKEENKCVRNLMELIISILLYSIKIQSIFMVKVRGCADCITNCTRQHKDSRYIK